MKGRLCSQKSQNVTGLVALLKDCAKQKDLQTGIKVHADILKTGLLEENSHVGSTLVSMYAKCGALTKAQDVFDGLRLHDLVTWNALISGYAQQGHNIEALKCYDRMQQVGMAPDVITLISLLKACTGLGAVDKGEEIHAKIAKGQILEKNDMVGNALVNMYAKCGEPQKAQEVFNKLNGKTVISWNCLLSGFVQRGFNDKALKNFEEMVCDGISPDEVTLACILKACGSKKAALKGAELHAKIIKEGFLNESVLVGNALVDMYVKLGTFAKAQDVFDELPVRDVVSWNSLIAGYALEGHYEEALCWFGGMQHEGISSSIVTLVCILKACASIGAVEKGQDIHNKLITKGLLRKGTDVGNALVDMYAKCGALDKAQEVFNELHVRDVVSWNALIAGYVQHGNNEEALNCFGRMQCQGFSPNNATLACLLKACGNLGALDIGKDLHAVIVREGLQGDVSVGNALIDMYAKCGALENAQDAFDGLHARDVISWTVLIAAYSQHGNAEGALSCFEKMQNEGYTPDAVALLCILKAVGSIGATDKGEEIHVLIRQKGFLEKDVLVGSALVDMYTKCGAMEKAKEVFDELHVRTAVSWTALITGYAQLGHSEQAVTCFEQMLNQDLLPDAITFTVVLNSCSNAGLVEKGQVHYQALSNYGIIPTLEHHSCMVDLFARAGHFDKAVAVINKMSNCDYLPMWMALLGACRKWGNVTLGRLAFEHSVQLCATDAAPYLCMIKLYVAASLHDEAEKVEAMRIENKAWNKPGSSCWTDIHGHDHRFSVGGGKHAQIESIYIKLKDLVLKISTEGYSSELCWLPQDMCNDALRDVPCAHTEKLAIACALINTSEGAPIRIVKNMQICDDCHLAVALISKVENRKIMVRDTNFMHIFENGSCTCGD